MTTPLFARYAIGGSSPERLPELHSGRPAEREVWDPLKQFIYSLLSSRTKTEVTVEVVRELEARFGQLGESARCVDCGDRRDDSADYVSWNGKLFN